MTIIENATIQHYHSHLLEKHTEEAVRTLGWKNAASQRKRFEVLSRLGAFDGCDILDVGCGIGDFKMFLDKKYTDFTYIGIDQMSDFITTATSLYTDSPNTYFYQADFTKVEFPRVDYVCASGVLSYRCTNPDFYRRMIKKMYGSAKIGLAFNMLDKAHFPEHPLLVGHDFDEILKFCQGISSEVKVEKGYLKDDFTLILSKKASTRLF